MFSRFATTEVVTELVQARRWRAAQDDWLAPSPVLSVVALPLGTLAARHAGGLPPRRRIEAGQDGLCPASRCASAPSVAAAIVRAIGGLPLPRRLELRGCARRIGRRRPVSAEVGTAELVRAARRRAGARHDGPGRPWAAPGGPGGPRRPRRAQGCPCSRQEARGGPPAALGVSDTPGRLDAVSGQWIARTGHVWPCRARPRGAAP